MENWRGRLGLSKQSCKALYDAQSTSSPVPVLRRTGELGEKIKLRLKTWDGEEMVIPGYLGESIMHAAKRADIPIEATCGGECQCATCQVYIQPSSASIPPPLPTVEHEEEDQLEFALSRKASSRLACQITITRELEKWMWQDGGVIDMPRY